MTFGKKIYLLRKKKGYSQDTLAEKTGCNQTGCVKMGTG